MERTPLHNLSHDDLVGLILQLRKQLDAQAKWIEELESERRELRKKNPTLRLEEAYSVKSEEKRREDAQQSGKPKKKKQESKRRGRIWHGNHHRSCVSALRRRVAARHGHQRIRILLESEIAKVSGRSHAESSCEGMAAGV